MTKYAKATLEEYTLVCQRIEELEKFVKEIFEHKKEYYTIKLTTNRERKKKLELDEDGSIVGTVGYLRVPMFRWMDEMAGKKEEEFLQTDYIRVNEEIVIGVANVMLQYLHQRKIELSKTIKRVKL